MSRRFALVNFTFLAVFGHHLETAAEPVCTRKTKVLITAFEPFHGRPANGSQVMANTLAKIDPEKTCVQFNICTLPVEYDRGPQEAKKCFESQNPKPDLAISMGEGGYCQVSIEASANPESANSAPDSAAQVRTGRIRADQDWSELYTMPAAAMVCAVENDAQEIMPPFLGPHSGEYVCNHVAFEFAKYLKPKKIPFAFVHVPSADGECFNSRDRSVRPYNFSQGADQVVKMIHAATRALSTSSTTYTEQRFETHFGRQLSNLSQVVTSACRQRHINQMARLRALERRMRESPVILHTGHDGGPKIPLPETPSSR